jgi:hypothetical protein
MKQSKHLFLLFGLLFINLGIAQNYNPIINYRFDGTPVHGVKIKTNIPFENSQGMPTITIEGYQYGTGKAIGLTIVWYIFDNTFRNYSVSSFGDYVPSILLSNENGKVSIFISDKNYYDRFTIRGYENLNSNPTWFQGWTIVDEPIATLYNVFVPYKNSFAGDVKFKNGIWDANGNVGIGTSAPGAKLEVKGNISTSVGAGGKLTLFDNNSTRNNRIELFANENGANIGSTYGNGGNGNINFNTVGGVTTMKILENGNVGIGTTTPLTKFEIYNTAGQGHLTLIGNDDYANDFSSINLDYKIKNTGHVLGRISSYYGNSGNNGSGGLRFYSRDQGNLSEVMRVSHNGNVGIGMTNPLEKLEVRGNIFATHPNTLTGVILKSNITSIDSKAYAQLGWGESTMGLAGDLIVAPRTDISGSVRFFTNNGTNIAERFKISGDGNAALQGKFQAKELKVTNSPTADFVFEEDYNLPKLETIEKHIKEKKHLPEIASAKEMEKEGVNVGEFQIKLLQKIEELTLYVIDQNKKINELEKEVKALRAKK